MIEPKGLRSVGQQTAKLSDELKELIKVVTELESRLDQKLLELDSKMMELDDKLKIVDDKIVQIIEN